MQLNICILILVEDVQLKFLKKLSLITLTVALLFPQSILIVNPTCSVADHLAGPIEEGLH